jgi:hypothetical protein
VASASALSANALAATPKVCLPELVADSPTVALLIEQEDINGHLRFEQINDHGELLFVTKFNQCDGRGRPETNGGGDKRAVPTVDDNGVPLNAGQIAKLRTSALDSDSCGGCHNDPQAGGAARFSMVARELSRP